MGIYMANLYEILPPHLVLKPYSSRTHIDLMGSSDHVHHPHILHVKNSSRARLGQVFVLLLWYLCLSLPSLQSFRTRFLKGTRFRVTSGRPPLIHQPSINQPSDRVGNLFGSAGTPGAEQGTQSAVLRQVVGEECVDHGPGDTTCAHVWPNFSSKQKPA